MIRVILVCLVFLFVSCGTSSSAASSSETSKNKNVLPPNTGSNKYSKVRQH